MNKESTDQNGLVPEHGLIYRSFLYLNQMPREMMAETFPLSIVAQTAVHDRPVRGSGIFVRPGNHAFRH